MTLLLGDLLLLEQDVGPPVRASVPDQAVIVRYSVPGFTLTNQHWVSLTTSLRSGPLSLLGQPPAGPRLRNFIVEVEVEDTTAVPRPRFTRRIRVHVHEAVRQIWLTPRTLTVHQGSRPRFTVLARFDDETVGDITNSPSITFQSDGPVVDVDATGALTARQPSGTAGIQVTAGPLSAVATAVAAGPWASPREVRPVDAKPVRDWRQAPNVLFLPEGFTATEEPAFLRLVRSTVDKMRRWQVTQPLGWLKGSVNYWTAFVPSRDAGVNFLPEVSTFRRRGGFQAKAILPTGPPPDSTLDKWSLDQLVSVVGLPVPVDDGPGRAKQIGEKIRLDWQPLFGDRVTKERVEKVYDAWLALAGRTLLEEHDAAFGFAAGNRPRLQDPAHQPYSERRISQGSFQDFLRNLRFGSEPIGPAWSTGGKDQRLVCVVFRTGHIVGANFGDHLFVSLGGVSELPARSVAGRFEQVPHPIPRALRPSVIGTVAHELGHSFNLDEEYGERRTRPPSQGEADAMATDANIQPLVSLRPPGGQPGEVDANRIKWLWPRIAKAGVVTEIRTGAGGTFLIALQPGHAATFAVAEMVRLRRRPLVEHPTASGRLRISGITGNVVTVTQLDGPPLDPAAYPGGADPAHRSMLFAPVVGADASDLPLVAPIIQQHIRTTRRPLYTNPNGCDRDKSVVQRPQSLPTGLPRKRPRDPALIVGLYEGGGDHACGVFHPTGACLMRNEESLIDKAPTLARFCPVCRYAMVDLLDPALHREIDRDYGKEYPQP